MFYVSVNMDLSAVIIMQVAVNLDQDKNVCKTRFLAQSLSALIWL